MAMPDKLIDKYTLANAYAHKGKAQEGAVLGKILSEMPDMKSEIPKLLQAIKETIKVVNKIPSKELETKLSKIYPKFFVKKKTGPKTLPDLQFAKKGKVIMRFEPSPSGPLHIGHAYVLSLNSEFCRKYNGKLIVRLGDTNPENIYSPAYSMIQEDAQWITKNNVSQFVIQSNRIKTYYTYLQALFRKNLAYVCTCNNDKWKKNMLKSIPCLCRNAPKSEQMKRWKNMLNGKYKEGAAVIRIKTDMDHPNPAMRDWPAFRIIKKLHPRQGKKYKVWPLMNFSVAIDDHDMGITHAIRAKEHIDNEKKQKYIYDYFGWEMPTHLYVGRINFEDLRVSCSKTRSLIEKGKYKSWDDVRLPFLAALKKRGYQPDAFIKHAIEVGVSANDKTVSGEEYFETINKFDREVLDANADRFYFVSNPIKIQVEKAPVVKEVGLKIHPDKKKIRRIKVGKYIYISKNDFEKYKGEEIRLKGLFNIKLNKIIKFTSKLNKDIPKVQWISDDNQKIEVLMPNNKKIKGLAESNVTKIGNNTIVQFERFGFVRKGSDKLFIFGHK